MYFIIAAGSLGFLLNGLTGLAYGLATIAFPMAAIQTYQSYSWYKRYYA